MSFAIMLPTLKQPIETQSGYSLIELMITIAIFGILAALAIPMYYQYIADARRSACLSEVKGYSNQVFYRLNDPNDNIVFIAPVISACESITNATGWTLATQQKILAIAKAPSNARIECDIPNGTPCIIVP